MKYRLSQLLSVVVASACVGCSAEKPAPPTTIEYQVRNVPGAVEYTWEEPMVDVIEVPPGLDPEGHYYRPAHEEVVEIRQGRWQYYKKPAQ